jgi:hypothetical protein
MRVLSISNSFGVDATRYLHQIARSAGVKLEVCTLYIGGCPLELHYRNMLGDKEAYDLYFNGFATGFKTSISEALLSGRWDVVSFQQASPVSPKADTYTPYAEELYDYIKTFQPKAKVLIHQTWAYEDGSLRLANLGYETAKDMFADIEKAYDLCAQTVGADGIIPCGKLMMTLLEKGIEKVHRDTFHASLGLGRYAQGLLWFKKLTGKSVADINYNDFDEEVPAEQIAIAKEVVESL